MDLIEVLKRTEGKTLEFKRDTSSPTGIVKTVIAFSNTTGGKILIGIEDKSKHIIGIDNPLHIEEQLSNIISDKIIPRILPNIEIVPWRDSNIRGAWQAQGETFLTSLKSKAPNACHRQFSTLSAPSVEQNLRGKC